MTNLGAYAHADIPLALLDLLEHSGRVMEGGQSDRGGPR